MWPSLPLAVAGLVGASLAPTDAAFDAPVIADERLPVRVRRVLNEENRTERRHRHARCCLLHRIHGRSARCGRSGVRRRFRRRRRVGDRDRHRRRLRPVRRCAAPRGRPRRWTEKVSPSTRRIALALIAYLAAVEIGGNPFVAAFIGGLAFGAGTRPRDGRISGAHRADRQPAVARAVVRLSGRASCSRRSNTPTSAPCCTPSPV